ncbi:nucleolin-like [Parus major]|uniref:nucleolin-like n=1 Tax=Parus major TaxID=9157 RepID=UPI00077162EA|nr:nucleolin-like [Parus major]
MPEPAPLGGDRRAAEKKRVEKVGAKGSAAGPPVPRSLPVQSKVEPPSLDPAEEPLLWEGLTLNKCILVASVVALLSVTFQVLQAPCSKEGLARGRQEPPPPPVPEVVSPKAEEIPEVVTAQPAPPPDSGAVEDDDDDDDGDDYDDSEADSNLAEPWIFKKWFGRTTPEDEEKDGDKGEDKDEDEDKDEEPADIPEVPIAVMEEKKSQEKKLPQKKRDRERKERKERRRERDEARREGWKGRPGRAEGGRESPRRDWKQQKGRKPWELAPGRDGRAREGKRRD